MIVDSTGPIADAQTIETEQRTKWMQTTKFEKKT